MVTIKKQLIKIVNLHRKEMTNSQDIPQRQFFKILEEKRPDDLGYWDFRCELYFGEYINQWSLTKLLSIFEDIKMEFGDDCSLQVMGFSKRRMIIYFGIPDYKKWKLIPPNPSQFGKVKRFGGGEKC